MTCKSPVQLTWNELPLSTEHPTGCYGQEKYDYSHFRDEETEVQREEGSCLRSHSWIVDELGLGSKSVLLLSRLRISKHPLAFSPGMGAGEEKGPNELEKLGQRGRFASWLTLKVSTARPYFCSSHISAWSPVPLEHSLSRPCYLLHSMSLLKTYLLPGNPLYHLHLLRIRASFRIQLIFYSSKKPACYTSFIIPTALRAMWGPGFL